MPIVTELGVLAMGGSLELGKVGDSYDSNFEYWASQLGVLALVNRSNGCRQGL